MPKSFFDALNTSLRLGLSDKESGSLKLFSGFSSFSSAQHLTKELVYSSTFPDYALKSIPSFFVTRCKDEAGSYSHVNSVVLKFSAISLSGTVSNSYGASEYTDAEKLSMDGVKLVGAFPSTGELRRKSVLSGINYE